MRPKGSAEELERRRRRAIALLQEGLSAAEVARIVGVAGCSVSRWRQAYEAKGDAGLAAKPHPGGRSKLTQQQRERLAALLVEGPRKHGYDTELWTLSRVAEVILIQFGVSYDPSGVWHVLRSMGWSSQKPERRARERHEEAIEQWRQDDWPRIKKNAGTRAKRGVC